MDYLNDIINTKVSFSSFGKGLVMFKTRLFLNISSITEGIIDPVDIQKDKKENLSLDGKSKATAHTGVEITSKLGEPYEPRRSTFCQAVGTVYGMAQKWKMSFTHQSITGMNQQYLDEEGRPNAQAILKRLREIAPDVELKEQRLNLLLNRTFATDFYDNATTLLVLILREYYLAKFFYKTERFEHEFNITAAMYAPIFNLQDEAKVARYVDLVTRHENGAGTTTHDLNHYAMLEKLDAWFRTAPAPTIMGPGNTIMPNEEFGKYTYTIKYSVWKMYDYDDGHSSSGPHFGDHFDFHNGMFIVPTRRFTMDNEELQIINEMPNYMPMNEAEIKGYSRAKGYLNLTGVSSKEKTFLNFILNSQQRQTPFLVDQHVPLGYDLGDIAAYHCPEDNAENFDVTPEFIASLMAKLINIHRWHEDALSAYRALRYWVAQPATETVESHWWTHTKRQLALPRLGLRRAIFGFMLEGEGVSLTHDGHNIYRQMFANNDALVVESLMANTCWYWGEYLLIHNAPNLQTILERQYLDTDMVLKASDRADAMYGAMIGRAIPTSQYLEQVTYIQGGLTEQRRKFIPFGKISLDGEADYGYKMDNERKQVMLRTLAAPGCVALIVGLNGQLLQNTPYASIFSVNNAVRKVHQGRRKYGLNYNDLWAVGVINRWQGHDTKYYHPKRSGVHKIFAANSVSIAMPPVTPATLDEATSYTLERVLPREHQFGTPYDRMITYNTVYTWTRMDVVAQITPTWDAEGSGTEDIEMIMVKYYKTSTYENKTYKTHLMTDYDFKLADFRLERTVLAVPLPDVQGILQLPELTEIPDPVPDEPNPV
uniref:Capsid protein n=1 Tax=Uromyces fabae virus TaxID=3069272 RepID=A0AA51YE21_9VIRU|nr:putative capsid protein [Uromyces fabae virus]